MAKFQYLPGVDNTLANALSQQDWKKNEKDKQRDPELRKMSTFAQEKPQSGPGDCGGLAPQKLEEV